MSPVALPLLRKGPITLSQALAREDDILFSLSLEDTQFEYDCYLWAHRKQIEAIVAHHLAVPPTACHMPNGPKWLHGTFNVVIPITVDFPVTREVVIRFPLPYKVGEHAFSGNIEEKLRSEVATYAWVQDHCPSITTPHLFGYSFPSGPTFTALDRAPLLSRLTWHLRRFTGWMVGRPGCAQFVLHQRPSHQTFKVGYILMEHISQGAMLSETMDELYDDPIRRATLFKDLARILHSLAKHPFPRIGSLSIDNDAVVSLTNRPLTMSLVQLENEGIRTAIPRGRTYESTVAYIQDLLTCHDNRLREHPNTVIGERDGHAQLANLTAMRAVAPHFSTSNHHHGGPFSLQFTDLHGSNLFVDEAWHITCLIDLEWVVARPLDMFQPPRLMGGGNVDQSANEKSMAPLRAVHAEFVSALEEIEAEEGTLLTQRQRRETQSEPRTDDLKFHHRFSGLMRQGLRTGSVWFFLAVESYSGLFNLFMQHIVPTYGPEARRYRKEFEASVPPYWQPGGMKDFISEKLKQREAYLDDIRQVFAKAEEKEAEEKEAEEKEAEKKKSEEEKAEKEKGRGEKDDTVSTQTPEPTRL